MESDALLNNNSEYVLWESHYYKYLIKTGNKTWKYTEHLLEIKGDMINLEALLGLYKPQSADVTLISLQLFLVMIN